MDAPKRDFCWPMLFPLAFLAWALFFFVRTGDTMLLIMGLVGGGLNAAATWWVWNDAPKRGMDRMPWSLVTALTSFLGLVAYVAVREMKRT